MTKIKEFFRKCYLGLMTWLSSTDPTPLAPRSTTFGIVNTSRQEAPRSKTLADKTEH